MSQLFLQLLVVAKNQMYLNLCFVKLVFITFSLAGFQSTRKKVVLAAYKIAIINY